MVVERFSQNLINTGIFKVYVAIGFFATIIFFILNSELFTPIEMVFGAVCVTVTLKGLSNIMLSLVIDNYNLDDKKTGFDSKYNNDRLNRLIPAGLELASENNIIENETENSEKIELETSKDTTKE